MKTFSILFLTIGFFTNCERFDPIYSTWQGYETKKYYNSNQYLKFHLFEEFEGRLRFEFFDEDAFVFNFNDEDSITITISFIISENHNMVKSLHLFDLVINKFIYEKSNTTLIAHQSDLSARLNVDSTADVSVNFSYPDNFYWQIVKEKQGYREKFPSIPIYFSSQVPGKHP